VPTKDTDPGTFSGLNPSITFVLDVADNTPPTLHLPADSTVEGSEVGGAPAAYSVTADDVEDATDPTPSCDPALGDHLPLGKTTVECSVTDGGGLTTEGSFDITVVDTTAPVFANVADITVDTGDPTGRAVDYGSPSLREVVDPSPTAGCSPASGSTFPVGTTTVRCTATDGSGNTGRMSFDVTVRYVPLVVWSAVWGEPVAAGGGTFVANLGRSVPVKVDLLRDGVRQTAGTARLAVTSCAGGPVATSIELTSDGGRWSGKLDTGAIGATGCYLATATLDGQVAGSFRITLRGADGAPVKGVKAGQP
jgi:hypothetical protein